MKLNRNGLKQKLQWTEKDICLPEFDIDDMVSKTQESPEWVHFGSGNIFRGFIGSIIQKLLNANEMKTGIIAVETFDFDIIDKIYKPYDNLTLNIMIDKTSNINAEVLAGVADSVKSNEYEKLCNIFAKPSLKMVSYTITEKGYAIKDASGFLTDIVNKDIANGTDSPKHAMSVTASLLYHRYKNGAYPIAVVSMDNCSHNGEKLQSSIMTIARAWSNKGSVEKEFIEYLESKVSFPWSMIDKITPRPSDAVRIKLTHMGVEDMESVITKKGTYIAPFVNAEIPEYLVVEDSFPNGRPPLEKAGVYMTDRETVNKSETMKVTTCLNPLHTALAVYGCVLGYNTIWEEMQDRELAALVRAIVDEGMKVVSNPGIISPEAFAGQVINDRLPNPNIPDMPQRIATDTSQKVGIRYGETIKSYVKSDELDASELNAIPLAIAGWMRYLLAVDDSGNAFERSADPMLDSLTKKLSGVRIGDTGSAEGKLTEILSDEGLFGINLYTAGIGEKIEMYFKEMIKGTGAVRALLKSALK